ncbi:MAG: carotenoid 1,2-hydratase [Chloroflexi bacterium]|nr:carotenoid 1,2-hydratase [Chloroflexota bacterium]
MHPRHRTLTSLLLALVLLAGCAAPREPGLPPAPPPTPAVYPPVTFPKDEAPHNDLTEWWYYTGHLQAADGRQWGFEHVVFQVLRANLPPFYISHFAVTDRARKRFVFGERSSQGVQAQPPEGFALEVGGWSMRGLLGQDQLAASTDEYAVDLRLSATKPPVLHDGGLVTFGPAGDSYYYSRTRMEISGAIVDHGERIPVTGLSWFDKQWGNFVVVGGGWDWFSLHLDDGTELMLNLIKDDRGVTQIAYGTYVAEDGQFQHLPGSQFEVSVLGQWTSPHTGFTYPSGWRATLPGQSLDLTIRPVIPDQELNTQRSTGKIYWEGAQEVTGTRGGQPLSGRGYVELVGYER